MLGHNEWRIHAQVPFSIQMQEGLKCSVGSSPPPLVPTLFSAYERAFQANLAKICAALSPDIGS